MRKLVVTPEFKNQYEDVFKGFLQPVEGEDELTHYLVGLTNHDDNLVKKIHKGIFEYLNEEAEVTHVGLNVLDDMILATFIIKTNTGEDEETYEIDEDGTAKLLSPYWFNYTYNLTVDYFSELGDVYVQLDEKTGKFYRAG